MTAPALAPADRTRLRRRALHLAYATIGYNLLEAIAAGIAGIAAGSIVLVGIGLDSVIEVFAAGVVVWHLRGGDDDQRERWALRLIAVTFFLLAAYVIVEALRDLIVGADPDSSRFGVAIAALSLVVMPALARAKRRTGTALGDAVVLSDAAETRLSVYLSVILVGGLLLNATVGWSWADPLAALVIAGLAVSEGRAAWQGEGCC